jgi:arylsulfatase A-like enzyme
MIHRSRPISISRRGRRGLARSLLLVSAAGAAFVSSPARAGAERPSFVLILADDLGYGDLGSYGSPLNRTPHIDRLATEGLRFTDFHSNGPMCTPTRAALLTGRYQQRFGPRFEGALSGRTDRDRGLPLEAVTIAEALQEAGYATGMYGKWHLGYQAPFLPPRQGFDEFRGLVSGDGDHHTHVDRSGNRDWWHDDAIEMEEGYTAELITRHSSAFIERHRDEPFFLFVSHLAIHFPWQGPDDPPHRVAGRDYWDDKWGVIPDEDNVAPHVKAMVEALDESVGAIVATLRRLDLDRQTLVFFTSDNGGYIHYAHRFHNISSNGPLRGQKTDVFEGGHRVPAIAWWPGRIRPGVSDQTVATFDLFPTLLSMAGVESSSGRDRLDGVDLSSLLLEGERLPARTLFWRIRQDRAVRQGPWKLVSVGGEAPMLFDLARDLGEERDVAGQHPDVVEALQAAAVEWAKDVDANEDRATRAR